MTTVTAVNSLGGYEYNPRGNIWLNDDSTLGHKLLMKMGWSKGKGLGKNENGIKENIKIKVKSTSSGVGFKDESFFKIQSTDYDSLLKSISTSQSKVLENGAKTSKQKNGGLEQRSQAFRNRLHYQKFVRGKDLSKYSEKDMKSIFILNKTSEEKGVPSVPEDSSSSFQKDSSTQEEQCTNLMDTYNSSLSISEYFSLKMKGKKNMIPKTFGVNADTQPIHSDSEKLENESASLISAETTKVKEAAGGAGVESTICMNQELPLSAPISRKRKSKKSKQERNNVSVADADETDGIQELNGEISSKHSKKRKKNKVLGDMCADSVISNNDQFCQMSLAYSTVHVSQPATVESTCSKLPYCKKDSVKKQKKLKKMKQKHLKMLKSCLKSKNGQYSVKNVSFSENVSYKIIDSEPECLSDSPISCSPEVELKCVSFESENSTVLVEKKIPMDTQVADSEACIKMEKIQEQIKTEMSGFLSHQPCSKSSSYNPWIESQRQAMKMNVYKNMLQNIKNHNILKTTNLLFIRGYGNWDY